MNKSNKTVRVFISSTFRDMHAERDHLVTVVFPELRERLEQLGLEFFDVDLRWGVPSKDANGETANSWEYCRQWIDRVDPFFVCILGQRYGWVPTPSQFRDPNEKKQQEQEPRSITDLEVRYAFLTNHRKDRSYFYLRKTLVPNSNQPANEYIDPPEFQDRLTNLKTEVLQCGRPVRHYQCCWTGQGFTEMEEFGRLVLDDLWSGVLRDERYVSKDVWRQVLNTDPDYDPRYTSESQSVPRDLWKKIVALAKPIPQDPLYSERQQMEAFASSRLRWFQGRTQELKHLTDFISSTAKNSPHFAIIVAAPGQGKSALIAKLSQSIQKLKIMTQKPPFLITHFVGATEKSASTYALVLRLLDELDHSGIKWPTDELKEGEKPKQDFNSLCERLYKRLCDYSGERQIVILLDALNQLTDNHDLHWLPSRLGPSVRLVVSCVDDSTSKSAAIPADRVQHSPNGQVWRILTKAMHVIGLRQSISKSDTFLPLLPGSSTKDNSTVEQRILCALLSRMQAPLQIHLNELTPIDVHTIVVAYLNEYCKELDKEQLDAICRMNQAKNPLYLLVMLGELRTLGGNEMNQIVGERITALPHDFPDTVALFRWVLQRMEVFGLEAVQWWCLYLVHGSVGMSSNELAELLARKLGQKGAGTALLIERGLRRYLLQRGRQLDFFHGQLRQAVLEQYGSHVEAVVVHSEIAEYFHHQDWFFESLEQQRQRAELLQPTQRPANLRKVIELPLQCMKVAQHSKQWHEVEILFTDLLFLEAKVEAGLAYDLAGDFSNAVKAMPMECPKHHILKLLHEALVRDIHFIANHPTTVFQCLWNTCWWYDCDMAKDFYEIREGRSVQWASDKEKLCLLLEHWRKTKEARLPGFRWFRSLLPPRTPIGMGIVTILETPLAEIEQLAFDAESKRLSCYARVTHSEVRSGLHIWTLEDWVKQIEIPNTSKYIRYWRKIEFSPDGLHFILSDHYSSCKIELINGPADFEKNMSQIDPRSKARIRSSSHIHSNDEYSVLFSVASPDGKLIALAESIPKKDNYRFVIIETKSGKHRRILGSQGTYPTSMTFSKDGKWLVTTGWDYHALLWDTSTGKHVRNLEGFFSPVVSAAISPDARFVACGCKLGSIHVFQLQGGVLLKSRFVLDSEINRVGLTSDNKLLTSIIQTNKLWDLRTWNIESGECLEQKECSDIPWELNNCTNYSFVGYSVGSVKNSTQITSFFISNNINKDIAWLNIPFMHVSASLDCRTWVGSHFNEVFAFRFEGDLFSDLSKRIAAYKSVSATKQSQILHAPPKLLFCPKCPPQLIWCILALDYDLIVFSHESNSTSGTNEKKNVWEGVKKSLESAEVKYHDVVFTENSITFSVNEKMVFISLHNSEYVLQCIINSGLKISCFVNISGYSQNPEFHSMFNGFNISFLARVFAGSTSGFELFTDNLFLEKRNPYQRWDSGYNHLYFQDHPHFSSYFGFTSFSLLSVLVLPSMLTRGMRINEPPRQEEYFILGSGGGYCTKSNLAHHPSPLFRFIPFRNQLGYGIIAHYRKWH